MALSATRLATAIKAAVVSSMERQGVPAPASIDDQMWDEVASAIITEITTNALVSSTVTVTSVSAVTPGPGVSGPGVGTATGTVS